MPTAAPVMIPGFVHYRPARGEPLEGVVRVCVNIATLLDVAVECNFNGVSFAVDRTTNIDEVLAFYRKQQPKATVGK